MREARMAGRLKEWSDGALIPAFTHWNKQNKLGDSVQCGIFRVDFVYLKQAHVVLLEYDEDMHSGYDQRCEMVRMGMVTTGYPLKPAHWVRYNPDAFKVAGTTRKTAAKAREAMLLQVLQAALAQVDFEQHITIDYVCYDKAHWRSQTMDQISCRPSNSRPSKTTASGWRLGPWDSPATPWIPSSLRSKLLPSDTQAAPQEGPGRSPHTTCPVKAVLVWWQGVAGRWQGRVKPATCTRPRLARLNTV
jgi:hypothetical protein